jgi:hypothetical protein
MQRLSLVAATLHDPGIVTRSKIVYERLPGSMAQRLSVFAEFAQQRSTGVSLDGTQ